MAKVYMDTLTNQIVTPDEAEIRLFTDTQDFEWKDTITSFSWEQIEAGLTEDFKSTVKKRFEDMRFSLRFTEYEIYGDESNEGENGKGDNRIWPPEDEDENGDSTNPDEVSETT
jgi:hypothetical protein